jgi:GNAT superfamily N-acetyltransferase
MPNRFDSSSIQFESEDFMSGPPEISDSTHTASAILLSTFRTNHRNGDRIKDIDNYMIDTFARRMVLYSANIVDNEGIATVGAARVSHRPPIEDIAPIPVTAIDQLAIIEPVQRRGIGRLLIGHIAQEAINRGNDHLMLRALTPDNIAFYENVGFGMLDSTERLMVADPEVVVQATQG